MLIKFLDGSSCEIEILVGADLSRANLSGAYLSGADLSYANLSRANLSGANLSGANLSNSSLPDNFKIARLDFGGWSICVYADKTSIGCQTHTNDLWLKADPRWIDTLDDDATVWWKRHGAVVQAVIRDVMSQNQE